MAVDQEKEGVEGVAEREFLRKQSVATVPHSVHGDVVEHLSY